MITPKQRLKLSEEICCKLQEVAIDPNKIINQSAFTIGLILVIQGIISIDRFVSDMVEFNRRQNFLFTGGLLA